MEEVRDLAADHDRRHPRRGPAGRSPVAARSARARPPSTWRRTSCSAAPPATRWPTPSSTPAGAVFDAIGKVFAGKQNLTWQSFPGPLPVGGDIIEVKVEENVMEAGVVAIVLKNTPDTWWWKGVEFREFDADGNVVSDFKISTDPNDGDVWDPRSHDVLPLYTPQLRNGSLEFKKAAPGIGFGIHTGYYVLGGLDQGIKDRARVTFRWEKD